MLSRIFDTDNIIFRFFSKVGYIWWLHTLWLVCSLPIITIGASTTALCYSCMKLHKKEGYVTKNFFHSFKENFVQSTILFLIFLVVGSLLLLDLILGNQIDFGVGRLVRYGAMALLIPYFMTLLYVFAVQAKFVNSISKTIKYAFGVAWRYFKYTLQIILIVAGVFALNMTIILFNVITLSIGVGIVVYILAIYYNRIFDDIIAVSCTCSLR
uniref:Glycerophosphoryl diester phosphodiesterase membrane domain-containing protein n=1 Tax=uncultured prokaryote TaxID=198431 RepID=A0A0H5PYR0_9ZZZZ|nr:hypothetical protein [uncultured prokaryote]